MNFDYDVVIIGGAFSGAATALMLKRKRPEARVLIIEKNAEFDRKVGESTTEVSSCYMTRILGLTHHLGHDQIGKQGLRFWFCKAPDQRFDDCVEIGTRYQSRLQTFQVDRAKLDTHLLERAVESGCALWRPAKVTKCDLNGAGGQTVAAVLDVEGRTVRCRWVVDATGRAAMLARKLGHFRQNQEHPINAVWARFSGVKDWDSYDWRERFPDYAVACRTARSWATNHLMGHGWWCWIIPLRGGDVSAGIVYDSRIFQLPEGANIAEKVCGDGWACVGDAAGFIDPFYSPGLDFCSYTSNYVADFIGRNLAGEDVTANVTHYNVQYPIMYRSWFEALYKDKYYYMGDAELMSAGFLLDVASYYFGLVIPAYRNPEKAFLVLPFHGRRGRIAASLMKFYNRRLVALAKRRLATGHFARRNAGWRELYDGFVPDCRVMKLLRKGLLRWWKAELTNLRLMFASPAAAPTKRRSAVAPMEV